MAARSTRRGKAFSVPKYRLHKPSGLAVVRLDGRDVYLGRYGTPESQAEYQRVIAEWCAAGRTHGRRGSPIPVKELVLTYWRHVEVYYVKNGRPTSEQHCIRGALRPLRRLYGETLAEDFGPLELKAVRQAMIDQGLTRQTINGYVSRVVSCFRWGVAEGLIPSQVLEGLRAVRGLRRGRTPAREREPVTPVNDEIVEATLPHLPKPVADMVRVQRLTGMRPGEVCAITTRALDLSGEIWLYAPSDHKNAHHGKPRVVPIGPRAQALLRPRLRNQLDEPLFQPDRRRLAKARRKEISSFVGFSTASYRRAIARACERAGLPQWSPNQLRHSCATDLRRRFGIDVAGAVLGHSRLETTQVYAERNLAAAIDVAAKTG